GRQHNRKENRYPVETRTGQLAPKRIGQDKAQAILEHHQRKEYYDVVLERVERPAGIWLDKKHRVEILESNEVTTLKPLPIEEGISEGGQNWVADKQRDEGQRRHKQHSDPEAATGHTELRHFGCSLRFRAGCTGA